MLRLLALASGTQCILSLDWFHQTSLKRLQRALHLVWNEKVYKCCCPLQELIFVFERGQKTLTMNWTMTKKIHLITDATGTKVSKEWAEALDAVIWWLFTLHTHTHPPHFVELRPQHSVPFTTARSEHRAAWELLDYCAWQRCIISPLQRLSQGALEIQMSNRPAPSKALNHSSASHTDPFFPLILNGNWMKCGENADV